MGRKNGARTYRRSVGYWLHQLLALPSAAFEYAVGKWGAMSASDGVFEEAVPLQLSPAAVAKLMYAWSKPVVLPAAGPSGSWSMEELALIERIRSETVASNRNNVTRTEAYRSVYFR